MISDAHRLARTAAATSGHFRQEMLVPRSVRSSRHAGAALGPEPSLMTNQTRQVSVRPHGDRWGIVIGDEVVMVARTEEEARAVAATAAEVLANSAARRRGERRSFSDGET